MKIRRNISTLLFVFAAMTANLCAQLTPVGDGSPGPVKAQHLTAELVSYGSTIAPGGTLQAGLVLTMEDKWHVYWINAGDAGYPPSIKWTLPAGLAGEPSIRLKRPLCFGHSMILPFTKPLER